MKLSHQFTTLFLLSFMTLFVASCGSDTTTENQTTGSTVQISTDMNSSSSDTTTSNTTDTTQTTSQDASTASNQNDSTASVSTAVEDTATSQTSDTPTETASSSTSTTATETASTEETYSQDMTYRGPRSSTTTNFTITVEGDTITSASASMVSGNGEDSRYQSSFASQLSSKVVGKTLAEVANLSTIGGASLTTDAFQEFVSTI